MMRRLVAVVSAVALGCGSKEAPPGGGIAPSGATGDASGSSAITSAPPAPAAPMSAAAAKDRLIELARRVQEADAASTPAAAPDASGGPRTEIPAFGPCTRPTADERAALTKRITTWSARPAPGLRAYGDLELAFGCTERGAIVIDAARAQARGDINVGLWWVLRVTPSAITIIDQMEGDARDDWMEWAREDTVTTLALVDLDGDGTLDPVRVRQRHEGGSVSNDLEVVTGDAPGTVVGGTDGELGVAAVQPPIGDHALVISVASRPMSDPPPVEQLRCVTTAASWSPCPFVVAGQQRIARAAAADLAINTPEMLLADPGLLDEQLAVLGVPTAERAPLLAYATANSSAFATAIAGVVRSMAAPGAPRTRSEQAAVDARDRAALGAGLRAALNEPACAAPTAAQARATNAAVTRWIRGHERKPSAFAIESACTGGAASYAIAHWARETPDPDGRLRAGLFFVKGAAVALVVDASAADDGPGAAARLAAKFSVSGPALVALVETDKLTAVVDGAVTGTHALPADLGALTWSAGTADGITWMADDPLARTLDGDKATYWHATRSGVVAAATIAIAPPSAPMAATDPVGTLLETSERIRAARDLLATAPTSLPSPADRIELLAAAKLLGAPPALLAAAAAAKN